MQRNQPHAIMVHILEKPWKTVPSHKKGAVKELSVEQPPARKLNPATYAQVVALKQCLFEKSAYALLQSPMYNKPLLKIAQHHAQFVRPLATWKRRSQKVEEQFSSLLQHLFEAYKTPQFLHKSWFSVSEIGRGWYFHLAAGGSVRQLPVMPFLLNKKMAHFLRMAPAHLDVVAGFRWAQVMGLGGSKRLFQAIVDSGVLDEVGNEDFWHAALDWLVRQDHPHIADVGDMMRYFQNQLQQNPDFSIKGRSRNAVMRSVNAWLAQLAVEEEEQQRRAREQQLAKPFADLSRVGHYANYGDVCRASHAIRGYTSATGKLQDYPQGVVTISQIMDRNGLHAEANAMQHCVGGYGDSCSNGFNSIWSMQVREGFRDKRLLTIQVALSSMKVLQVRGKYNREPTLAEMKILQMWATNQNLKMSLF